MDVWWGEGMSICHREQICKGMPEESRLLSAVSVRLIREEERERYEELIEQEHYLHHARTVGAVLRYVAEYEGQWLALLTFSSAALHLKPRDQFLNWTARRVSERRHLIVQNSRFLVLASTGRWPNLASRVLRLVSARLSADWQEHFGHPVRMVESFVDPQRFAGTCYRAAGWQPMGATRGFARRGRGQDFYQDLQHPKELWVLPLGRRALQELRAEVLAVELRGHRPPAPPPVPVPTAVLDSLWAFLRPRLKDHRDPHGVRYPLVSLVCLAALAVGAGCQGPHAIAEFARSLNHSQRARLRLPPCGGTRRQHKVPCERTIERFLAQMDPEQLKDHFSAWMAQRDPEPLRVLHVDGKVLRNADPAPPRLPEDPALAAAAASIDTPLEMQKPKAEKALTLVNFQTPDQRLVDQVVVPSDTNEEAAVAARWSHLDLRGVTVMGDAAHTTKANCFQLTQVQGADYIFPLKGNQPTALAKAKQLLTGASPPCSPDGGQGPRADRQALAVEPTDRWRHPGSVGGQADLSHRPQK